MEKIKFKIKVNYSKLRNPMHLEIQKNNRMNIFRDKTKYTRKQKHKGREEY